MKYYLTVLVETNREILKPVQTINYVFNAVQSLILDGICRESGLPFDKVAVSLQEVKKNEG